MVLGPNCWRIELKVQLLMPSTERRQTWHQKARTSRCLDENVAGPMECGYCGHQHARTERKPRMGLVCRKEIPNRK